MAIGQLDRLVNVEFIEVIKVSFICLIAPTLIQTSTQNPGQTY
jgi:hypothetical protein